MRQLKFPLVLVEGECLTVSSSASRRLVDRPFPFPRPSPASRTKERRSAPRASVEPPACIPLPRFSCAMASIASRSSALPLESLNVPPWREIAAAVLVGNVPAGNSHCGRHRRHTILRKQRSAAHRRSPCGLFDCIDPAAVFIQVQSIWPVVKTW